MNNIAKLVTLLTIRGHSDIALNILDKTAMPRKTKRQKHREKMISRAGENLIAAVERSGGKVDEYNAEWEFGSAIYDLLTNQIYRLMEKVYSSKNKNLRSLRLAHVQDSASFTPRGDDEDAYYWIDAYFPEAVTFSTAGKLDQRKLADDINQEILRFSVKDPNVRKKASHDTSLLKFVGGDFLEWLLKDTANNLDFPPIENSDTSEEVVDFAYNNLDFSHGVSEEYEEYKGRYPRPKAKLDAWTSKVLPNVSFLRPWTFRLDVNIQIQYRTLLFTDREYDDYL